MPSLGRRCPLTYSTPTSFFAYNWQFLMKTLRKPRKWWQELSHIRKWTPDTQTGLNLDTLTAVNRLAIQTLSVFGFSHAQAENKPSDVSINPRSYFSFDVSDKILSVVLNDFSSAIRFPTWTTFLDSTISTLLDPPIGFRHWKFTQQKGVKLLSCVHLAAKTACSALWRVWTGTCNPDGQLKRKHFFEPRVWGILEGQILKVNTRRTILEKLGYLCLLFCCIINWIPC